MAKKRGIRPKAKRRIVRAGDLLPEGYEEFLGELKERIRTARLRASLAANRELIELYWHIGRSVVEKQKTSGWGNDVIAHLGDDLQKAFPGESGFSRTNVYRMRALFLAYQGAEKIVPQLVGQISETGLLLAVAGLPWGQNVVLIEQIKDLRERLWYARATFEHGWSRAVLAHWIESDLYKRQGKAQTNFARTLPSLQSDLARETLNNQKMRGVTATVRPGHRATGGEETSPVEGREGESTGPGPVAFHDGRRSKDRGNRHPGQRRRLGLDPDLARAIL